MTPRCLLRRTEPRKLPQHTAGFYTDQLTHAVTILIILGRLAVRILAGTATILTLRDFPQLTL